VGKDAGLMVAYTPQENIDMASAALLSAAMLTPQDEAPGEHTADVIATAEVYFEWIKSKTL